MSVYTLVQNTQVMQFLDRYNLNMLGLTPIHQGTVNSNFHLYTDKDDFILTIFEKMLPEEIVNIFSLQQKLYGLVRSCPEIIPSRDGNILGELAHKPAALISKIKGHSPENINISHVKAIGNWLGQMHYIRDNLSYPQIKNTMGKTWREETIKRLAPKLPRSTSSKVLFFYKKLHDLEIKHLPQGFCHCDLFPDNTLFTGNKLEGVIDFYYAAHETLLYDLAICVNSWCMHEGNINIDLYEQLIASYTCIRPLLTAEKQLWQEILQLAAFRFWLSRLESFYFTPQGKNITIKDPSEQLAILEFHAQHVLDTETKHINQQG